MMRTVKGLASWPSRGGRQWPSLSSFLDTASGQQHEHLFAELWAALDAEGRRTGVSTAELVRQGASYSLRSWPRSVTPTTRTAT
jgi:hypothetical protein